MSKPRTLDQSALLRAIDLGQGDWLAKQSDEAIKDFAPMVTMRYATGVADDTLTACLLWMINRRVNRHLFDLHKHPDLSFRLLATCHVNQGAQRHTWIKGPSRTPNGNAALALLAEHHPLANEAELRMLLSLHTRDSFKQLLDDCAMLPDKAKTCLGAYDTVAGV